MKKTFHFTKKVISYLLTVVFLVGFGFAKQNSQMIEIKDYCDRTVQIQKENNRIVLMADLAVNIFSQLGADSKIVGLDNKSLKYKNSLYAYNKNPELCTLPDVGKTNNPNIEAIMLLNPSLVVFKGDQQTADSLQSKLGVPVVCVKSKNGYDFELYKFIGKLCNKEKEAQKLVDFLKQQKTEIEELTKNIPVKKNAYISIQGKKGDFYKTMKNIQSLELAGINNVATSIEKVNEWGQCEVIKEQILVWNPDTIFLDLPTSESCNQISDIKNDDLFKNTAAVKNNCCFITGSLSLPKDYVNVFCEAYYYANCVYPEIVSDPIYKKKINDIFSIMYGNEINKEESYFENWNKTHKSNY